MNIKHSIIALGSFTLLVLPSCIAPNNTYAASRVSVGASSYSTLPYGYQTVHVGGYPYYYYGNSWYRRNNGRYFRSSRPSNYNGSIGRSLSRSSSFNRSTRPTIQQSRNNNSARVQQNVGTLRTRTQTPSNLRTSGTRSINPTTRTSSIRPTDTRSTGFRSSNTGSSNTRSSFFQRFRSSN
ncbi:hypothetical protein OAI07_00495 [Akkermansiaceae bacterium]|nr:hypothetical protein [Akkermansiaceae bacterium]